ncbi:DUF4180 domain-containing protein [Bacillus pseudomycoides]|uniref:DUF4180 domain-containing protein n=2 Tax=Bacillus pseudomycoides TaxID=64104 RepID=A0A2H3MI59_9BACI|nr:MULTISPECIES: DUF4180 domain-containing protein [Bacillus]EEM04952.1 hypothetical protein bmyco0002_26090 [Bacillus pseudomycoides]EEM16484.1 hypothetical protein bpmyx0001_28730 [Bacillus pseudomycoides DSM 12442]MCX2824363.1 DUF4180 domain-containing protein [Bacillus sp. DHT2]MDR4326968.1 DUF4180 domain-containing protein [Bacillus pseudomycoides]MDR4915896.1 DUF4180 domain-containing protein [Bacillus pseudomycoides]
MKIRIHEKDNSKIAIIESSEIVIRDVQGALDLMASVNFSYDCQKILINKVNITEEFFNLRTGLAGEILQKYMNYRIKLAIVGDFNVYNSKSLADFIYECNKGKAVFFLKDEESALSALHCV